MADKGIQELVGKTDIYLLDQILKGRYVKGENILDVGCGEGRNLTWFYQNKFNVTAIDSDENRVYKARVNFPRIKNNIYPLSILEIDQLEEKFDHIICNAVLHFAESIEDFKKMFFILVDSLKSNGSLFIRMTSDFGLENEVKHIQNGVYSLPDGTNRFLLTRKLLKELESELSFSYLEPLKTVNVNNTRCMSTLILTKE